MMMAPPIRKPLPRAFAGTAALYRGPVRPLPPWQRLGQGPSVSPQMTPLRHGLIQRKCPCDVPATGGGACSPCAANDLLQPKLAIGSAHDPLEREADRVADQIVAMPATGVGRGAVKIQRATAGSSQAAQDVPESVPRILGAPGRPLDAAVRQDMEQRFGHDFSRVRVHTGGAAGQSANDVGARAYTVGANIVFGAGQFAPGSGAGRALLAHELVHTLQQAAPAGTLGESVPARQSLQRTVLLGGKEMGAADRQKMMKSVKWSDPRLAQSIMDDMAAAGDVFDFADGAELQREIVKRAAVVHLIKQSQSKEAGSAFGYPFTSPSELYGPRVNWSARDFWAPSVPDGYNLRTDKAKNKDLLSRPRSERSSVYGDQPKPYAWHLTASGKKDPYLALTSLFTPQPPHKRTLFHCDYLASVIHFLSFAESIGKVEFNKRIAAFGAQNVVLHWDGFMDLNAITAQRLPSGGFPDKNRATKAGLGSLDVARPSSEADLILGDHVIFWNHLAYDLLNAKVGNAWRLENAIVIARSKSGDTFLGHGSGSKTKDEMHAKLAKEYNEVAAIAIKKAAQADAKDVAARQKAEKELAVQFPNVKRTPAGWKVEGTHSWCKKPVSIELRLIWPVEVVGLRDPCSAGMMNTVRRPVESKN